MDILRSKLQRTIKLSTVSSAFVQRAFQSSEAIPSGSLLIWGSGDTGQLGCNVDKADVPIHLDEFHGKSIEDVAVSSSTSFAVTDAGELYSWGKCEYGSLGHGTASQTVSSPAAIRALDGIKVVQVSAGANHAAAVSDEGDLFTWGWGGSFLFGAGGLGHGDTVDQPEPALVEYFADEGIKVKSVRCGSRHTIVLTTDGRVFTFGNGEFGRLGNGNMKQLLPQEVEMFEGKTFSEVQAGRSFSLALESNGTLWGFGKNDHSQLGLGANMAMDMNTMEEYPVPIDRLQGPVASIAAGARHSVVCNTEGALYYWGQRTWIEPQLMTNVEEKIISVAAGEGTSAAISESGRLYTWGRGMRSGALGHGIEVISTKVPRLVEALINIPIAKVAVGHKHGAAIVGRPTVASKQENDK